ncbi:MAG: orotidine-5'-phosphate decarboxylase [Actinomycetota bacterium]
MGFHDKLTRAWLRADSMVCVGLDPDPAKLPESLGGPDAVFRFCADIVDATADLVCAFKPQIAYFAAIGAEVQLERLCEHIRSNHPDVVLILDAKRGDIGPTAERYAEEAFVRYGADAVTVNPYLGSDTLEPFFAHAGRGLIVLCRTSNPGSADFQSLETSDGPVFAHVARRAVSDWSRRGDVALVVGATYPEELATVRSIVGDMPLLVPGIGAQGGDIKATVRAGRDSTGYGMMINSSRAIIYASSSDDYADAARHAATDLRDQIRSV